jgi:hypothetical protein
MIASSNRKERAAGNRGTPVKKSRQYQQQPGLYPSHPAAGAHAAAHLTNEDATPGAGALPNLAHDGREVDGAAG